ncbi:23S rRNA (adenine2030-N6)-methyltransferase [Agitococcus lubricus]|uniref:Ribosomal RNA large subunit methyltransferase J n=2 Tax=Agitococcus lubricus TaxID=1077255 RepID=A0A2T5IV07_9GAMM|nr:23S rRNA (adenine2030-N6)-methyltransferase [Agitococcus lubricus]
MKHILLIGLLQSLHKKDNAFCYIDTHAGQGWYDLAAAPSQKTGEYLEGIRKLNPRLAHDIPWVDRYFSALSALKEQFSKAYYGGSPWFAFDNMRPQDRMVLLEFHPVDAEKLKYNFHYQPQVAVHHRDAYEGLTALIPPKEKRGLVLIDPPYEEERQDYPQVVELLAKAHAKWPTGTFAIWYPIKDRILIERFERRLVKTGIRRQLVCELCVMPDDNNLGLNGSGLLIVNPPYQFSEHADKVLHWLLPQLSQHPMAKASVKWLVGE